MKKYPFIIMMLVLGVLVSFSGCTGTDGDSVSSGNDTKTQNEMDAVAEDLVISINGGLEEIDSGLSNNSEVLSKTGLMGEEAGAALSENLLNFPWAIYSLVITSEGIVVTAVPGNYEEIVGTDLSWQEQVQKVNSEEVPVVSDVFTMAEGFTGISQSYPVFSDSGEYLGYTDMTYKPETFLGRQIEPVIEGTPYDVWVAQTDGTLIYDTKSEEIGNNLFSDSMYSDASLQEVLTRIAGEESGTAEYVFSDRTWSRNVTKTAIWRTAGINGAEWRVVVTYSGDNAGEEENVSSPAAAGSTDSRYDNLTTFVDNAAVYAKENGKEAALKEFNDVNGSFIDGELYVFAYEMNGTVIALPYQQELLGAARTGISDSNGVEFINGLIDAASDGGGSIYYIYPNPEDNFQKEFKLSYVVPVDDDWFVGSGIYLPEIPAEFNISEKDELVKRVKNARDYAQENGKEKAVSDFNDLNGTFADGGKYIFAYDYEGNTLALPYQPEYIGINRLDLLDTYGVKILGWESSAAKSGGGFVYVQYFDPDTGEARLKLCYVSPVDDEWFVGSGIYTERL
ncbi:putative cache sensor protein [Methanolacinia petrolearia DSM 11571]|uniref:Putative cache sensor protein n=1 Tax=Methanolacinia petrolearia (strain DSM 11571 / OCM 486 / SEBR 4847) TaxID=679926 RepID=E1RGS9_METP4|nr:cache domain-containing protein [Methanolacinia petrolearia]ADN37458.1 putative cache sensor protein [Methanolacinia petrolearia DSM 11571]